MSVVAATYDFLEAGPAFGKGGATARVHGALREAIVSLELKPGAHLDKLAIAAKLGVSRFPVGEALSRLHAERLVDIVPQAGSRVALITIADARENMFLRRAIDLEAVRTLTKTMSAGVARDMRQNLRYQAAAIEQGDRGGFHVFDLQFHAMLLEALGFERVKTVSENARLGLERVRRLLNSRRRLEATLAEHEAIAAALERRDMNAAQQAVVRHLDQVLAELEVFAKAKPELFADLKQEQE